MSWLNCVYLYRCVACRTRLKNWGRGVGGGGGLNGWEGAKRVDPPLATTRGYGGALQAPPSESGAEPQYPRKFFLSSRRYYTYISHVHVCIGSGRYCTNVLRVQSESVLQPLYIKLKGVPKKTGGGGPCLRACYWC